MNNLVTVVACYGEPPAAWEEHSKGHRRVFMRTDKPLAGEAAYATPFLGYETGAFLWAYWTLRRYNDAFLFVQDSMLPQSAEYREPFLDGLRAGYDVVAYAGFPLSLWDCGEQIVYTKINYAGVDIAPILREGLGFFGCAFAATRDAMDTLAARGVLPSFPMSKLGQQAKEREWAIACTLAGLKVKYLHTWDPKALQAGECPPFTKEFRNRNCAKDVR